MRALYLEPFAGISGNMLLGALLDAGVPFEYLQKEFAKLHLGDYELVFKSVNKSGIQARYFNVLLPEQQEHEHTHGHCHDHEHGHHHDHEHDHAWMHAHGIAHSHDHEHIHEENCDHTNIGIFMILKRFWSIPDSLKKSFPKPKKFFWQLPKQKQRYTAVR